MMPTTPVKRPPRGYALMFVLAVALALGILVSGLFSFLAESVSSSKQAQEELQQLYGCDGALRLAIHEASKNRADTDIAKLQQNLGILSAALRTDINPRTRRPFADIEGIRVVPETIEVRAATSDPFFGLQFVQEGSEFIVTADPEASRGRTCRAQSPNRLRTISYFQFAVVSNDILMGRPSNVGSIMQATPGTGGDIYALQHSSGSRRSLGPRRIVTSRGDFTVQDIHISDQETFRPVPPSGQPWSFINKKKKFFGGTKRRTRHKRPVLEYFTKYPTNKPGIDPTLSRFAMQADIRIIDGEWYVPNAFGSFPGTRLWSDRPGLKPNGRTTGDEFTYSAYETSSGGRAKGGAAIISYGIQGKVTATSPLTPLRAGVCGDFSATDTVLAGVTIDASDNVVYKCPDGTEVGPGEFTPPAVPTANDARLDPYVAAASTGFFDPFLTGGKKTPMLPIVVDVAALGSSMTLEGAGDLGAARCISDDVVRCPEQRRFRGAVWIGSLPSGIFFNGTPKDPASNPHGVFPDGTSRVPCPLAAAGDTSCARPNALVLINADDLSLFQRTGLSIASNLPMYVIGNVNSATPDAQRTARVALMAPSITALSADFDLATLAWTQDESAANAGNASQTLDWRTSLFTAWASPDRLLRDPRKHILRRLQSGLDVNVTGSVVAMFRRQDFDKIQVFNSSKGSFSSPKSDPLVAGIPMFAPDRDNPEEAGSRLTGGTIRYPGESERDLRRAAIEHQPPASPRFSIDPAPIDRR